jgi:hypothetical protein
MDADPADLVRSGYNALSRRYRGDDDTAHEYDRWLAGLRDRLPERGHLLDIGCGCGIPVARHLTAAGRAPASSSPALPSSAPTPPSWTFRLVPSTPSSASTR